MEFAKRLDAGIKEIIDETKLEDKLKNVNNPLLSMLPAVDVMINRIRSNIYDYTVKNEEQVEKFIMNLCRILLKCVYDIKDDELIEVEVNKI